MEIPELSQVMLLLLTPEATEKATKPCFSPFDPISMTSLARIFSLIGVDIFFLRSYESTFREIEKIVNSKY